MADVTIHRCTLRVIRRGGWSWGPAPRRLVETAARLLPFLLARQLEGLWPENAAGEITELPRLRLRLRLADLQAIAASLASGATRLEENPALAALEEDLAQAVALLPARLRPVRWVADDPDAHTEDATSDAPAASAPPTPLAVLLDWRGRGTLPALLRGFSEGALDRWEQALRSTAPADLPASPVAPASELPELLGAIARTLEVAPDEALPAKASAAARRQRRRRHRLLALVEIAARTALSPASAEVRAALDRALPIVTQAPAARPRREPPAAPQLPVIVEPAPTPASAPAAPRPGAARRTWTAEALALPFLLLGPLDQIGFLDAAGAAFVAAGQEADLPAFAAGLAFKVLPPPERGWRRLPPQLAAAAAFAGAEEVPPELGALADQAMDDLLSPLRALLARAVLDAHTPGQPLLIEAVDGGLLVGDAEGLFPIALSTPDDLPVLLRGMRDPLFLRTAAAAPALLAALDRAGLRWVTDAPPTRDERWRRLEAMPGERWWSNDDATPDEPLCALARPLPELCDELALTWRALVIDRPCAPRPRHADLDRTLALAAGMALAFIAWALWRTRETAHPRLALHRFGDLGARVGVGVDRIEVGLPMGRRHQDLRAHRLLEDVVSVPWLPGRRVHFAGG
jgi:hypothetical protein